VRLASPGVVLEVTSVNGSVNSDTAALVALVRSDIASVGAEVSSVVASVMQPEVIHKTPKHRTARQCVLLMKSSDRKTLATGIPVCAFGYAWEDPYEKARRG
jgi:hypothetical protein